MLKLFLVYTVDTEQTNFYSQVKKMLYNILEESERMSCIR